jgi:hypothetical protein
MSDDIFVNWWHVLDNIHEHVHVQYNLGDSMLSGNFVIQYA